MKTLIYLVLIISQIYSSSFIKHKKRILQDTRSNDIVILHTNDIHCGVTYSIGYDGLMLYKKQLEKKYKNVILVDVGDHIQGGTIGLLTNGTAIIKIMNKLGYEVATLGNHEFTYRIPVLEECAKQLDCGYISINYCFHANKTARYEVSKIIEKGGKKIGFIGVATPQTLSKTHLNSLYDSNGNKIYDFLTENKSQELYERIQTEIDRLKGEGVDYIIILGHLGIYGDALEENTSAGVIKNIRGATAFLDGHSHKVYSMDSPDKDSKNVKLAQAGTKLNNIGVLIIHENGTISQENVDKVPYDSDFADQTLNVTRSKQECYVDKEMNEYIEGLINEYSDQLKRVIGKSSFPLTIYTTSSDSSGSNQYLSRDNENNLCNLVADSFRIMGEADVTIMNAGTVTSNIEAGDITYQNIIDIMPYSNDVLIKEITGQNILDALEFGVRSYPDQTTRFPQVSGITYKIDTSINSTVEVDDTETFVSVKGDRRVYDVKVNGEDLDVNKKYTISSHNFILDGGDGYSMFVPCEIVKTAFGTDNEVLMKYISENLEGTIPTQYQTTENRIVKTKGKAPDDDDDNDNEGNENSGARVYHKKSNGGLSGGAIAAIVIAPIAVLAVLGSTIYLVNKSSHNKIAEPGSQNSVDIMPKNI